MPSESRTPRPHARAGFEVWLRGASLQRGGRRILRDIRWRIRRGERWVLVGANGAGKTQLLKLIAGAVWPDPSRQPVRRYRRGGEWLETPLESAAEIAYLGPERQDRYERYGWNFTVRRIVATGITRTDIPDRPLTRPERRRVDQLLGALSIRPLARRRFLELSYGQRRLVLFARALASRPQLLLLDEWLGGLDEVHRAQLQRWLEGRAARRLGWVLATHRTEEVPAAATGWLRLHAGRLRRMRPPRYQNDATAPHRVSHRVPRRRARPAGARVELLRFEQASIFIDWQSVLQAIDLVVHRGDCWVVHGANGAGKTTLLRAIWGDYPAARGGRIRRRGIEPGVPLETFQRRCGFVAPHQHTLQPPGATVLEVVVSGLRGSVGLDSAVRADERRRARAALDALGLAARAQESFHSLSYGTARRVLLARATVHRPQLLLLDELCAGLDPIFRRAVRVDVERLVDAGVTVVMSAHHRDEWPRCASHALELAAGRIVQARELRP